LRQFSTSLRTVSSRAAALVSWSLIIMRFSNSEEKPTYKMTPIDFTHAYRKLTNRHHNKNSSSGDQRHRQPTNPMIAYFIFGRCGLTEEIA
jgi:hypothetical protein